MSKQSYTPGPWEIVPGTQHPRGWIVSANGMTYDICLVRNGSGRPENFANARLIAAAPDLLEALQQMVMAWEYGEPYSDQANQIGNARAAITKALGE